MSRLDLQKLHDEFNEWRGRFDRLRVQANLGRKELRDKLGELQQQVEPVHQRAKQRLSDITREGVEETRVLASSVSAGWEQLRRTHRELSLELERELEEREQKRRS